MTDYKSIENERAKKEEAPSEAVWKGGVPESAGKQLFPKVDMEGENETIPGGEGVMDVEASGPAVNHGGNTGKSFLDDAGYDTGDMSVDNEPKMKIVNPDDISEG